MTQTMPAYRLLDWLRPGYDEVPLHAPGPGQVRVRVGGVGLCHTDVLFLTLPAGILPYDVPFTLGHEIAGWVDEVGDGVSDLSPGDAVAVACMSTCGQCRYCRRGADNYCVDSWHGRGFGLDGGLASHIVTARRDLVPIGDLEPRLATRLLFGMLNSVTEWYRPEGKLDADGIADAAFRIVFEGIERRGEARA